MGDESHITLRTYVEQRLLDERKITDHQLQGSQRALEVASSASQKALELQAKEYDRRLDILNHAHADATKERLNLVPREVFISTIADLERRIRVLEQLHWILYGAFFIGGILGSILLAYVLTHVFGTPSVPHIPGQ